jgi:hypothetical protein
VDGPAVKRKNTGDRSVRWWLEKTPKATEEVLPGPTGCIAGGRKETWL